MFSTPWPERAGRLAAALALTFAATACVTTSGGQDISGTSESATSEPTDAAPPSSEPARLAQPDTPTIALFEEVTDHNEWTEAIKAEHGFEFFEAGFSPDSARFVTVAEMEDPYSRHATDPTPVGRMFSSVDGKALGAPFETGLHRVDLVKPTDEGGLIVAGLSRNKSFVVRSIDPARGVVRHEYEFMKRASSAPKWKSLAFDGAGRLHLCVKSLPKKLILNKSAHFMHSVITLDLAGLTPVGSEVKLYEEPGINPDVSYSACGSNEFRYLQDRGELGFILHTYGKGEQLTQSLKTVDPATGAMTTHYEASGEIFSTLGVGPSLHVVTTSKTGHELRDENGQSIVTLDHGWVVYFEEPGLVVNYSGKGKIDQITEKGLTKLDNLSFPSTDKDHYRHRHETAIAFEPRSERVIALKAGRLIQSKPLTRDYRAARTSVDAFKELAEGGFPEMAAAKMDAAIATDPTAVVGYARVMAYYWEHYDIPPARIGGWLLTLAGSDPPGREYNPLYPQAMLVFSLMASANGHPAIGMQAVDRVAAYKAAAEVEGKEDYVAMYAALAKANALAANGDVRGGLSAMVPHRNTLQESSVRKWFGWYPRMFAPLGSAEPRRLALILGMEEDDLPSLPPPGPAADYVDLNGAPVAP